MPANCGPFDRGEEERTSSVFQSEPESPKIRQKQTNNQSIKISSQLVIRLFFRWILRWLLCYCPASLRGFAFLFFLLNRCSRFI